ncbi:SKA complex subunit 3 [Stegastes partitus]|uniref:Spindle and kinetochore associated complex subunit 3 n=1 Tax=Stegastes partitus TaxID=144197 RepID=A0A3B5A075_9TELE|nr:PREDICTED: spindle and kinetochore-associated protein 3 [Stegastes partitus]
MDPTSQFFSRLRKLAVTLESETVRLQGAFENRRRDPDSETTAKAMRTYHELNFNIGSLKGQIQEELLQQRTRENEVNSFLEACRVMEQRVSQDIQTLKAHWENYGYQAPSDSQRPTTAAQEADAEDPAEDETNSAEREEGSQEEDGATLCSPPPSAPTFSGVLRTPQLSDFGLSEVQIKRALAGAEWCSEVPPMPEMSLPHPALTTPAPPLLPLTPKCALRMDDDELQTPQMHDFGVSEHSMCLNNTFTMNLLQKNVEKPQRAAQDKPEPPADPVLESFQTKAGTLESPELPVLCTPGFKLKKTSARCASPALGSSEPGSPGGPNLPGTPEVPAFQTPYVARLVSTRKSLRQPEPTGAQSEELPTSPPEGAPGSKRCWEYDVPDVSLMGLGGEQMPEMPNLESVLGNSLQRRNPKVLKMSDHDKVASDGLELDGTTQEFSLGTPRIRTDYQEPSTPEMPDLSSVTQDICKLVSQAQLKKTIRTKDPQLRPEKDKHKAMGLSAVSDGEFQSLPNYLRQVTLHNLNRAVHNINTFTEQRPGETTEFQMEKLKRIISVGTLAPVYILCLTELKRLKHVGGVKENSVYKLITHN